MQAISQIVKEYPVDLTLFTLFESPTIETFSEAIAQKQAELADPVELAQLLGELEGLRTATSSD
jgi:hypothetical protein